MKNPYKTCKFCKYFDYLNCGVGLCNVENYLAMVDDDDTCERFEINEQDKEYSDYSTT